MKKRIYAYITCLIAALSALSSCDDSLHLRQVYPGSTDTGTPGSRIPDKEVRRVLLLYSCGFNSLSGDCRQDIRELEEGELPGIGNQEDILLVFGHHVNTGYAELSEPVLMRLYNNGGIAVRDTIKTWPSGTVSASSETLKEVLEYVHYNFRAREYNLIFSSHATGWLPAGYYTNRSSLNYDFIVNSVPADRQVRDYVTDITGPESPLPFSAGEPRTKTGGEPRTKTIGETLTGRSGAYRSYQMDLENFAAAIPMKLGSVMFDCCLMAGVETASALKDKCDYIVFSPAEILADGFDYTKLFAHFFGQYESDPVSVARDYYTLYENRTADNRSATVSVVDCSKIKALEESVAAIYDRYGDRVRSLKGAGVQRYYRYNYRYFFDLMDVLTKAGIPEEELTAVRKALDDCVIYKEATEAFMPNYNGFLIKSYCGLSCYLPAEGDSTLDLAYASTSWNRATGLLR